MTPWNFAIWCLQIGIIVAAGALLPHLFRLVSPKLRLAYWHVLLLTCLALPLVQPYRISVDPSRPKVSAVTGPMMVKDSPADYRLPWTMEQLGLGILVTGAMVRLVLLAAGLIRLNRLRRGAQPIAPLGEEISRSILNVGARAAFYSSEDITGPVTFGVRNPVVLLPGGFLDLAPEKREPVICHELLHVRRRDWVFAVTEEFIRAILWFHPAIWWLLSRIQLTREQVVDHEVIHQTNAREAYVQALLAIASARIEADLAPAPLFLRSHHLRQRVASIVEGVYMPKRHRILSSFAVFSLLPLVVGVTAWQFPLHATPQDVVDGPGIEVVPGPYQILHRPGLAYPADAMAKKISGDVTLAVTTNASGEALDARVLSGPDELRRAALQSVLNWHFAPADGKPMPGTLQVVIRFSAEHLTPMRKPGPSTIPERKAYPVEGIDMTTLPSALRSRVAAANLLQSGELLTPDRFQQVEESLRGIDDHLRLQGTIRNEKMLVRYVLTGQPASPAMPPSRIRVGGNAQSANILTKVVPTYPIEAKAARIQGTVRMDVTIDREGHVTDVQLVSGHPILVESAMTAVRQWVYRPTLLNGQPVEVTTTVDVNYTLLD